jgi:hypothetical protein
MEGTGYEAKYDEQRITSQRDTVKQVLLLAAHHDAWMTLGELARKTKYPEASISARIRDMRKPRYGGYTVEKRRVGNPARGLWEYRLTLPQTQAAA